MIFVGVHHSAFLFLSLILSLFPSLSPQRLLFSGLKVNLGSLYETLFCVVVSQDHRILTLERALELYLTPQCKTPPFRFPCQHATAFQEHFQMQQALMASQDGLEVLENPASHLAEACVWICSRHYP